jgi:hypothetical protein
MSYKIAIYTAVFGGKDQVKEPQQYKENDNIDYFLISDDKELISNHYHLIYKKPIYDDITKNARYYKIVGLDKFKNYDFVIWHDANIQVKHMEMPNLVKFAVKSNYAFFKHPFRNCIYEEAIKCIKLEKDLPYKLFKQVVKYFRYGVENNIGLYATGLYVKNNQLNNDDFINEWWNETLQNSRRDQMSLPYCLKKLKIIPEIISGDIRNNKYSLFGKHKHSKHKFISSNKNKSIFPFQKYVAIKAIVILKKLNFAS